MSFDIPASIEPDIRDYARSQHISENEAIIQLIEAGLEHVHAAQASTAILGAFSTPEERATMDEALDLAMQDRERRNG